MLKRTPSLTEQAKHHIKQKIMSDAFIDGRIPAETDLAEQLGISRTTVRAALNRLESEGIIFRKQGAGTFVNEAGLQVKSRLDEIWSYEAMLADHGYTASTHILSVTTETADDVLAGKLHLSPGTAVLTVVKLFLANDQPVILARNYIPQRLISGTVTAVDFQQPIYDFLWQHSSENLNYYLSEIVPISADKIVAAALNVPPQKPLIAFHETGYNDNNEPILRATSCFRDDFIRLRLIRRQTLG